MRSLVVDPAVMKHLEPRKPRQRPSARRAGRGIGLLFVVLYAVTALIACGALLYGTGELADVQMELELQ